MSNCCFSLVGPFFDSMGTTYTFQACNTYVIRMNVIFEPHSASPALLGVLNIDNIQIIGNVPIPSSSAANLDGK